MSTDNRKASPRQPRFSAWLLLGNGQLHGCVLAGASESGGTVEVQSSDVVPDNFTLLLSSSGSQRRQCRVVWRKPTEVGVKFERRAA